MTEIAQRVLDIARSSLDPDRMANSIIYLDWNPINAGEEMHIGDDVITIPWDAYVAFVDLEPGVNWGHECRYLIIRLNDDEFIQKAARMPPFLKSEETTFRFLWRGPHAPKWAVATSSE